MPEVGIVMTLNDKLSSALKTIAGNVKAFDKNIDELNTSFQGLTESQEGLITEQTGLKKALEASAVKVSDARKEYRKLKDEASKGALDAAIEEQALLQKALKSTEAEIKFNNKAYEALEKRAIAAAEGIQEVETRSESAAQGMKEDARSATEAGIGISKLAKGLATGQVGQQFAQSLGGFLSYKVTSAIGEPMAQLTSQAVNGALSGAAAGAVAGLPGIVAGGIVGLISGGLSGHTAIEQAKDDSFKSYVQENVEGQLSEMDSIRASGSATAGQREQDQIAFAQRFGSDEAAREYLDQVKSMAVSTNYSYDEITGYSKSLLNTYSPEDTLGVLQQLSDATAGLNLDSSGVSMFINGLSRMRTTGKVTQEYLNYFSERGLDVYDALSRSTGADKSEIAGMVTKGDISGTDAAQAILDYIQEEFGGLSEKLAGTYDAMVDNLGDAEANLNAMMGEGYNEARKEGIQAQTDWMGSGQMEEAYKAIGAWKAELENIKEQYIRDAVDEAMGSEAYQSAEASGDAAEMGRIIMQAKIKGMGEYNANEGKDEVLAQELSLIQGVRNDTALNDGYWDTGYTLGQEFSKGRAAAMREISSAAAPTDLTEGLQRSYERRTHANTGRRGRYAYGLNRVPYDEYPVLLHEGERVLTARETRLMDRKTDRLRGTERLTERNMVPSLLPVWEAPGLRQTYENRTYENAGRWGRYAYGLDRVPYDNYPALLHEGERVLTARETRLMDRETDRLRETERPTERNMVPSLLPVWEAPGLRQTYENRTYENAGRWGRYAYGLDRVPYDNYPALLHEGERVLTARETRLMDRETDRLRETERLTERNMIPSLLPAREAPRLRWTYENRTYENADRWGRYAYGLDRVPYDNYPALLHEGERVLTARETRLMDRETDRLRETERLTERNMIPSLLPVREAPGLRRTYENRTYENADRWGRYAYGLDRVPYDEYPALLHEGERVLTARETRLMDRETDRLRETERLTERNMIPSLLPVREAPPEPSNPADGQAEAISISITVSGNTFGAGLDEAAVAQALADQIALQLKAGGGR